MARLSYLTLLVVGCTSGPGPVIPLAAAPMALDSAGVWVLASRPNGHWLHRFRWQYQDDRSAAGGRGSAHIAGPDSIRFDVAGPLGASPAAAMVVGDLPVWVRPEDAISKLVPSYPLLWAAFGIARVPANGQVVWAGEAGGTWLWRAVAGADTIEWARRSGPAGRLIAEVRRGGAVLGRIETRFGADGMPSSARLLVPGVPARLDLTFTLSDPSAHFPADVWHPREP